MDTKSTTQTQLINSTAQHTPLSATLPTRYGTASSIPYNDGFDLKSVLADKPTLLSDKNDLMSYIKDDKPTKIATATDNIQQLLVHNENDRKSLVQIARQVQQEFMDAIQMD